MKVIGTKFYELVVDFANNFGIIVLVTIISMIARAIYKGTSIKRLLLKIPISGIIGIVSSVCLNEYTDISNNAITVICAITGAYAGEVLDGLEKLFKWLPDFIKTLAQTKLGVKEEEKKEDESN